MPRAPSSLQHGSFLTLQTIPAARTPAEKVAPVTHLTRHLSAVAHLGAVVKHVKVFVPLDRLAELANGI